MIHRKNRLVGITLPINLLYMMNLQSASSFCPVHMSNNPRLFSSDIVLSSHKVEIVPEDENELDEDIKWLPDREKAKLIRENKLPKPGEADPNDFYGNSQRQRKKESSPDPIDDYNTKKRKKRLTYTEEEEELIEILGGKSMENPSPLRESGFLGDSTLKEIAMDFQVPICYLADVLCGWGVPPPIDPNMILGDLVTGEQAFAILEAIHTLDVGSLNDRYADYDLATLCNEYDIDLADAFEMVMKEGWNLPFGVRTYLRVEQEEHLLDKLASDF